MTTWIHRLTAIDPIARTGVCAECGPVKLKRLTDTQWACRVRWRANNKANRVQRTKRLRRDGRQPYHKYRGAICENCGFVAVDKRQLDVHHKDGNHSNNDPMNLQTLCANCHRLV